MLEAMSSPTSGPSDQSVWRHSRDYRNLTRDRPAECHSRPPAWTSPITAKRPKLRRGASHADMSKLSLVIPRVPVTHVQPMKYTCSIRAHARARNRARSRVKAAGVSHIKVRRRGVRIPISWIKMVPNEALLDMCRVPAILAPGRACIFNALPGRLEHPAPPVESPISHLAINCPLARGAPA